MVLKIVVKLKTFLSIKIFTKILKIIYAKETTSTMSRQLNELTYIFYVS